MYVVFDIMDLLLYMLFWHYGFFTMYAIFDIMDVLIYMLYLTLWMFYYVCYI